MNLMLTCLAALAIGSTGTAPVNSAAPTFTLTDAKGAKVSLEDFRGKYVVLEWWNYQCPIVVKHYSSQNMQNLQRKLTGEGVVWLTICSSAPGKQGNVDGAKALEVMAGQKGAPTSILLDPTGEVGKKYDAKTTPHMFLVSPKGELLYDGAIDSIPSSNAADIPKAENYVLKAFEEAKGGKAVSTPKPRPYGCNVKY